MTWTDAQLRQAQENARRGAPSRAKPSQVFQELQGLDEDRAREAVRALVGAARDGEPAPPERRPCPREECDGSGWRPAEGGVTRCACHHDRSLSARMAAIPERFRAATTTARFRPWQASMGQLLRKALEREAAGGRPTSAFLCGDPGTGKTWLAYAYALDRIRARRSGVLILTERELKAWLRRRRWPKREEDTRSAPWERAGVHLVLDDLGRTSRAEREEWFHEELWDVVDGIYRRADTITVTSNWDLEELERKDQVDPTVANRLIELCGMGATVSTFWREA